VRHELESAQERLHALVRAVREDLWARRPAPDRWSIGECVAHVNLTSAAYIPIVRDGIARARTLGKSAPGRYRRDPIGWLLWKMMPPPVRMKMPTTPPFVPTATGAPRDLVAEFDRLQAEQIACVGDADGLALDEIKVTSPFNSRLRYNLYSCLTILPPHQHRHLWQAERVLEALAAKST
jgi:hypothetical protein